MLQEFVHQIKKTVQEQLEDVHTALPAKIVSINSNTLLATVQPTVKRITSSGKAVDYPQISGVPIVLPQGAGQTASVVFPVKAEDSCLLIISEQSLEYWLYGRETDTTLLYDISNAICIPGLFQKPPKSFSEACETNSVIIDSGESQLTIGTSGISVVGNLTVNGNLNIVGDISASGTANLNLPQQEEQETESTQ